MRTCDVIALVLFVVAAIASLVPAGSRFALALVAAGLAFTVAPAAFQWH
jgi:hypothetical protein